MTEHAEEDIWRTIIRQFDAWQLTDQQAASLLGIPEEDWSRIRAQSPGVTLTPDVRQRAGALLRIRAALSVLLGEHRCDGWVHRSNKAELFGGQTALDVMIEGGWPAIHDVVRYLEAELHG
jgi:hypothetical protein